MNYLPRLGVALGMLLLLQAQQLLLLQLLLQRCCLLKHPHALIKAQQLVALRARLRWLRWLHSKWRSCAVAAHAHRVPLQRAETGAATDKCCGARVHPVERRSHLSGEQVDCSGRIPARHCALQRSGELPQHRL
ncbi:hypothetical protein T492DRAFT_474481 [Pavlovales sp. CCMP2436]|nr:hypothetical protein T492DRAFT_474481 [Pavlovales sp. CCMP2436]